MNHWQSLFVVLFLVAVVNGRPQSSAELARGVKHSEQIYYNSDVISSP